MTGPGPGGINRTGPGDLDLEAAIPGTSESRDKKLGSRFLSENVSGIRLLRSLHFGFSFCFA